MREGGMKFKVVLYETEEGFTVFCPGCSRGALPRVRNLEEALADALKEALENIEIGIREFWRLSWEETESGNNQKDLAGTCQTPQFQLWRRSK